MKAPSTEFSQILNVTVDHIDGLHHVNNVQYLYWVQEIAKAHWREITQNSDMEGVWVVRQHQIIYKKPAFENDVLLATTYVQSLRGPLSERVVKFHNKKDHTLLVNCTTLWCYIEPQTRKVLPVPQLLQKWVKKS